MIVIKLNGKPKEFDKSTTIQKLLDQVGVDKAQVAVEVNRKIIPKSLHDTYQIASNDDVEIVEFIGGG